MSRRDFLPPHSWHCICLSSAHSPPVDEKKTAAYWHIHRLIKEVIAGLPLETFLMHKTSLKNTGCVCSPSSIQETTRWCLTKSGSCVETASQSAAADAPSSLATGSVVSANKLSKFRRSTEVGDRHSSSIVLTTKGLSERLKDRVNFGSQELCFVHCL